MAHFTVAGLQLALPASGGMDRIEAEIRSAKARMPAIGMILLPELCAFGSAQAAAQPLPGEAEDQFCAIAQQTGLWLVNGSMLERAFDGIYNTTSVISPAGDVVGRYRKMYPWYPYEQSKPGAEYLVFDVPGAGRFGVSNCYDMWFPETTRALVWLGAEVILHPSMTTTIDRGAECAIARANAAVNQCYFLDVNAAGDQGLGRSIFCGPGGEIIHAAGSGREIVVAEVDFEYVRRVRRSGWHGLGQPLKSFRDGPRNFPAYGMGERSRFLDDLGPLEKPRATQPGSVPLQPSEEVPS